MESGKALPAERKRSAKKLGASKAANEKKADEVPPGPGGDGGGPADVVLPAPAVDGAKDDWAAIDAALGPVLEQLEEMQRELEGLQVAQDAVRATLGIVPRLPEAKARETKACMDAPRKSRKSAVPADANREMLLDLLVTAERDEEERQRVQNLKLNWNDIKERIRVTAKDPAELFYAIDMAMMVIIVANALIIGLSMDDDAHEGTWKWVEFGFSIAFLSELLFKTWLVGLRRQFCSSGALSNLFDTGLILFDLIQFIMAEAGADQKGPSASLFRVVRLIRLTRILRVMRLEFFQGLLAMVSGMIVGAPTLLCAMGLFAVICYVLALVFRETIGAAKIGAADDDPNVTQFFRSVPQSLFMVFRCGMIGDCSTPNGMNAFAELAELYGKVWMLVYFVFIFGIVIGLFNVIGAIFVEETLKAAKDYELSQKNARLGNKVLWSVNIAKLITCILDDVRREEQGPHGEEQPGEVQRVKLSERIDEIAVLEVTCQAFDRIIREQDEAKEALEALDIDPNDNGNLNDILDPDNGGVIEIFELIDGLRRLRGEPRRSDIVAVDLMVRSLQQQLAVLMSRIAPK